MGMCFYKKRDLAKGKNYQLHRNTCSDVKWGWFSLHDSHGLWHMYICHFLFGHSTIFVGLLVFMEGTSCSVIRRNFELSWAVRLCYGKVFIGYSSAWFPLLSTCRLVEFDTSVICHVLSRLISIARYAFKSPRICFRRTKHEILPLTFCLLAFHIVRWARLRLRLFARTKRRFLSINITMSYFVIV